MAPQVGSALGHRPARVSTLTAALGPIESVRATGGERDLVVLAFTHTSGATSTATLSSFAPPAACGFEAAVWGEDGVLPMPPRPEVPARCLQGGHSGVGQRGVDR